MTSSRRFAWAAARTSPEVDFATINGGSGHACGVSTGGQVHCWGGTYGEIESPTESDFVQVSAGSTHNCGIREGGVLVCWPEGTEGTEVPEE